MDWLASILEIAGCWLVGDRRRLGFVLGLGCNVCWLVVALRSGLYGLVLVSLVMGGVNVRNFVQWGRVPREL